MELSLRVHDPTGDRVVTRGLNRDVKALRRTRTRGSSGPKFRVVVVSDNRTEMESSEVLYPSTSSTVFTSGCRVPDRASSPDRTHLGKGRRSAELRDGNLQNFSPKNSFRDHSP